MRQILLSYKLPYTDSLTISRVLAYPVGTLDVLVPDVGVSASGTGLIDKGLSDIQGSKFHSYSFENLKSNAPFSFTLSGQPSTPSTSASNTSTSTAFGTFNWRNLLIGLLSLALVGAIVAYWWTGRTEGGLDRTDALLQTLAQLDGDYAAGKLKEDRYQTRRSALKAELRPLLEKKHQSDQQAD